MEELKVGDVVRLKSGGPAMVVCYIITQMSDRKVATCRYWNSLTHMYCNEDVPCAFLVKSDPDGYDPSGISGIKALVDYWKQSRYVRS